MAVKDNNRNQNTGGASDGATTSLLKDLDVLIENLYFIENSLRQLQTRAQESNEASLNYYLEMAAELIGQRLKDAKAQQTWLAGE